MLLYTLVRVVLAFAGAPERKRDTNKATCYLLRSTFIGSAMMTVGYFIQQHKFLEISGDKVERARVQNIATTKEGGWRLLRRSTVTW